MPSDVGDYVYQGCYTDSPITGQHSLTGKFTYDPAMTLEKCHLSCEGDGYPWFGVEYGTQCFCGTRLYDRDIIDDGNDSDEFYLKRAFAVSDRQCSMRCGGDATNSTTCGGANRLSVYWNTEISLARNLREADFALMTPPLVDWDYLGCVWDDTLFRTLSGTISTRADMTVEWCTRYCSNAGYEFAGLAFQTECYCGREEDVMAVFEGEDEDEIVVDNSQCEELCAGDEEEFCGAPRRLSLYGRVVI